MFDYAKRQKISTVQSYRVEPQVAPLFSLLLVVVCLTMSVLLFGAGNFLGGVVFGSILVPIFIFGPEWFRAKSNSGNDEQP